MLQTPCPAVKKAASCCSRVAAADDAAGCDCGTAEAPGEMGPAHFAAAGAAAVANAAVCAGGLTERSAGWQ